MLYIAQSPFPFTYAQRGLWLQTYFYTSSTCQAFIWELHKMVRSISPAPARGGRAPPRRQHMELRVLISRAAPSALTTAASSNLHPHKSKAIQLSLPCDVQLLGRPKTVTKTSSWLNESQTFTSHTLWSSFSPWTPHRDCCACGSSGLMCRSYDYWNSSNKKQALSTFPWNLETLVKISNPLTFQSSNSLKSIDQVFFGSQHPLPQ